MLELAGALYASLSGSGSATYGLFASSRGGGKSGGTVAEEWHSGSSDEDIDAAADIGEGFGVDVKDIPALPQKARLGLEHPATGRRTR